MFLPTATFGGERILRMPLVLSTDQFCHFLFLVLYIVVIVVILNKPTEYRCDKFTLS